MSKAFVLLSGGLDSTTCLFKAIYDFRPAHITTQNLEQMFADEEPIYWVEAVSVNYGQRHKKEMDFAKTTCSSLGIKHSVLELRDIMSGSMLTDRSIDIPNISYDEIKGVSPTYVPFRNGTMLSLLAAFAEKRIKEEDIDTNERACGIYFGAHAEDAANWAYPDCTPEFIGAMANAIFIGTYQRVRLYTPLMSLMKHEIVELGHKLGVPFDNTWSCYKGDELHCGVCPTCRSRRAAFNLAGIEDPTVYADV